MQPIEIIAGRFHANRNDKPTMHNDECNESHACWRMTLKCQISAACDPQNACIYIPLCSVQCLWEANQHAIVYWIRHSVRWLM